MICYDMIHKGRSIVIYTYPYTHKGAIIKANITTSKSLPVGKITSAYADYASFLDASERTIQTYTGNIRQFLIWMHKNGIQNPTRKDILAYKEELKTRCKPTTIQNYITALRLFFTWTAQAGIYPNIAEHIKGAKIDEGHKKDYLNASQIKDILSQIDTQTARGKRDYCIMALMVTGGLRDIEVSRANIEDIQQLGNNTVLYLQGKGREERTEYIKIVPNVEQMLRAYLRTRPNAKGKQPLFTSLSNNNRGERLSTKSISALVKDRFIKAGYNSERLTAHSLRHSAVTLSLIGGLPLEEVQQFARHKNISTTQIYAHNLERAKNRSEETIANSIFN